MSDAQIIFEDAIEPIVWSTTGDFAFKSNLSIAVSLKRIADEMTTPKNKFQLRSKNGVVICTCQTMQMATILVSYLEIQTGTLTIEPAV